MRPVITVDTKRDITFLLESAAAKANFDPIFLVGGAIAESGLRERAAREKMWPDVSYGLWQPAVKWLGAEVPGLTRLPNGSVEDTLANRKTAQDFCFDAEKLVLYVAPRYNRLLVLWDNDPLEAWCRWNSPNLRGSENPNRANYVNGLSQAMTYRVIVKGVKHAADLDCS